MRANRHLAPLIAAVLAGAIGISAGVLSTGGVTPAQAAIPARSDFNGDGYSDLAVGIPGRKVGGAPEAGAVQVMFGSSAGLSRSQLWSQDTTGVIGQSQSNDRFGTALAIGDFNCDGFADLAVGVPDENLGSGAPDAGAVNVLYGSRNGLTATGNQEWDQGRSGVDGEPTDGDRFGAALAAGDYNGDGCSDLAVGAPGESVSGFDGAGAVNVLYGSRSGLSATGDQLWHQDAGGVGTEVDGEAEGNDAFGAALAAGDFNGDGFDELAIGIPYEDLRGGLDTLIGNAGAVVVLRGSSAGLSAADAQLLRQQGDIRGVAEGGDHFGSALAVGNFGKGRHLDLAIGVPGEGVGDPEDDGAGAVNVLYGSSQGLTTMGNQLWTQSVNGVSGGAEDDDGFGSSLAVGNFGGSGEADLAIAVPGEELDEGVGAVNVLYGSTAGLTATGSQIWYQHKSGMARGATGLFGSSVAAGQFGSSAHADLAVGNPSLSGGIALIFGSSSGLTVSGNKLYISSSAIGRVLAGH